MSSKRDLSLSPRKENQREAQPIVLPVQFSLNEIKQHFIDSFIIINHFPHRQKKTCTCQHSDTSMNQLA
jgi:hypothetical protein